MNYHINLESLVQQKVDCLILPVFENMTLSEAGNKINELTQGQLASLLNQGDLDTQLGHSLRLHQLPGLPATRVLCVYCDKKETFESTQFRKVIASTATALQTGNLQKVAYDIEGFQVSQQDISWKIRTSIELIETAYYRFETFKRLSSPRKLLKSIDFCLGDAKQKNIAETAILQGLAIAEAMHLTRDLANRPANHCTPTDMATQATELAKQFPTIKVEVLEKNHAEVAKMGAFLAVARGSNEPPKFVVIHYTPSNNTKQKPIVLVGKGVTFDSGGISIKPSNKMEEMKFDMTGAASVLGVLQASAQLKLPLAIIGVLPLTENLPSGTATKPGDVVTTLSGQTIEVLNTDAEGRLILADALTYSERFNPQVVIDIATLTGAIVVSLGPVATGLMSPNEDLAKALEAAGQESGDRVWRLPLWDDYQEFIKSNVADIANIGDGSGAGSITAACFLSHFTKKFCWAHLDIAGTAWKSGKDKAATGRPVPLLVQYLLNYCKNLPVS